MNSWSRALALVAGALVCYAASSVQAQTVRPVIAEYPQQALGHVDLINNGSAPLSVMLEAKGFAVSESGAISFQPLPPAVHLKLSATSFRIAPKQTYTVYYSAKADGLPAWFVLYAAMTPVPPRGVTGMQVQVELPHTVYLLAKNKIRKDDIALEQAAFDASGRKVLLRLVSHAANLARVLDVEVAGSKGRADSNGFPLFPNTPRLVEIPWSGQDEPTRATVRFSGFSVEGAVVRVAP